VCMIEVFTWLVPIFRSRRIKSVSNSNWLRYH